MKSWTDDLKSAAVNSAKDVLRGTPYDKAMSAVPWATQAAGVALLREHGNSRTEAGSELLRRLPVDADGAPLPWFTYGAIAFLSPRVGADWRVFEYGSGHSTLWWAARVREVVAAEHHEQWAEKISEQLPDNAQLLHRPLSDGTRYPDAPLEVGGLFDVIVIDGRERVWCAERCLDALSPGGVIIWDNSERALHPGLRPPQGGRLPTGGL